MKKLLQKIFSVKNNTEKTKKILTILGIKITFKINPKNSFSTKQKRKLLNDIKNNVEVISINNDKNSHEKILHHCTYNIRCGIAQFLDDYINGLKLSGYNYNSVMPVNYDYLEHKELTYNYVNKLIDEAKNYDIIAIQHEYGFWNIKDFDIENKNIDSKLYKSDSENNYLTYGIAMFDYLVDNLLKLNKKVVITWHTDFENVLKYIKADTNYKNIPFFRLFDNDLLKIIVMNSKMRLSIEKHSIPINNVIYMAHPVCANKIRILSKQKTDNILLGTFGYLFSYKGINNILEILKLLPDNFNYIHIGGPHPAQGDGALDYFRNNLKVINLASRASITGYIENDKLSEYISKIDLGLYFATAKTNYASGAINQFLLNGIPTLTSNGSSFEDLSKNWDCIEIMDDIWDYPKVAQKIIELVNDEYRLNELKINSRKFCENNSFKNFAIKSLENNSITNSERQGGGITRI